MRVWHSTLDDSRLVIDRAVITRITITRRGVGNMLALQDASIGLRRMRSTPTPPADAAYSGLSKRTSNSKQ
ncbi:MAG: hypothetical protein ACLT1W_12055 [Alistipes onderdonkii]